MLAKIVTNTACKTLELLINLLFWGMRSITKNTFSHSILLLLLLPVLFSCNNPDQISNDKAKVDTTPAQPPIILASLNAIAPDSVRKNFKNLISVADCVSPLGKYTTQVNSDSGGYLYFRQVFSYRPEPFEAVLLKESAWFKLGDSTGILPSALVSTVRNQALLTVPLELEQRFHSFENGGTVESQNKKLQKVKAIDAQGHYSAFYFDTTNRRLVVWEFINPERRTDTILVRFSDWKNTNGFNLPFHIDILQAKKQFAFNFTKIEINTTDFKRIMFSPAKLSRQSGKKK